MRRATFSCQQNTLPGLGAGDLGVKLRAGTDSRRVSCHSAGPSKPCGVSEGVGGCGGSGLAVAVTDVTGVISQNAVWGQFPGAPMIGSRFGALHHSGADDMMNV